MKPWHLVIGSAAIWWGFFASLFVFFGRNIQITCFPVMGLFLRAADSPPHFGYTDTDFYTAAAICTLAFIALGLIAIAKRSLPLALAFAALLSISSVLAMMPTIER
jgi:hypothetical protein